MKPLSPAKPQHSTSSTAHDIAAAARRDRLELVDGAHLAHAAHRVNGHRHVDRLDVDPWQDAIVDELDAVLHAPDAQPRYRFIR